MLEDSSSITDASNPSMEDLSYKHIVLTTCKSFIGGKAECSEVAECEKAGRNKEQRGVDRRGAGGVRVTKGRTEIYRKHHLVCLPWLSVD